MAAYSAVPPDDPFAISKAMFTALAAGLSGPAAAGLTACELEDLLDERGREVIRQLLQDHYDLRTAREEQQVQAFNTEGVVSAQVWGTCPRCGHELNIQKTLSTPIAGLREGRGLWAALTRRDVPVAPGIPDAVEVGCGCGHTHPGAPEQVTGCGVSFRLPTTPPDPPRTS